jgi:hypothetical protein
MYLQKFQSIPENLRINEKNKTHYSTLIHLFTSVTIYSSFTGTGCHIVLALQGNAGGRQLSFQSVHHKINTYRTGMVGKPRGRG